MAISGVSSYVTLDLSGSAQFVAISLLGKLNDFGEIAPGDTTIGRLLTFIVSDPALPPAQRKVIEDIGVKYNLKLT